MWSEISPKQFDGGANEMAGKGVKVGLEEGLRGRFR